MKRVLVTLSVLLCLNVSAQEQLFFFGFEDGMASFTESANALDSITQIQYYSHQGSNGAGLKPEEFELGPTYAQPCLYEAWCNDRWWCACEAEEQQVCYVVRAYWFDVCPA